LELPRPWMLVPLFLSSIALLVVCYFCLVFVAIMFSIALFLAAALVIIVIWPLGSFGLNFDGLFVQGSIKSKPKTEAGAVIEYFEFADAPGLLRSSLDRMTPIRSPRYQGGIRARVADTFRVGLGTLAAIFNVTRLLLRTAASWRHRRVYQHPTVLAKIERWL
jgi:hypothetical protein